MNTLKNLKVHMTFDPLGFAFQVVSVLSVLWFGPDNVPTFWLVLAAMAIGNIAYFVSGIVFSIAIILWAEGKIRKNSPR